MPRDADEMHLWSMLAAAREVRFFVHSKSWEDYQKDVLLRRAVERSVEIVGEAARRVSTEFKAAHPEMPWPKIVGQRHRLAHEYDTIDDATIWAVATKHILALIDQLERVGVKAPDETEP